jgi:hypothetical protein
MESITRATDAGSPTRASVFDDTELRTKASQITKI